MTASEFLKRYESLGASLTPATRTGPALRFNTLLVDEPVLLKRLVDRGVVLHKIPFCRDGFWIEKSHFSLGSTTEYLRGLYYIQDAAAQIPVQVLNPLPGETVLDCCAAPGGKTTQLAQWMKNKGAVVSCENSVHRMVSLKSNIERCSAANIIIHAMDASDVADLNMRFDKVLLDAPCAGNFASDPYWFEKRTLADVERNPPLQRKLLAAAVNVLKEGGTLVYSTCSLEPEENEMVIDWALKNLPVHCVDTGLQIGQPGIVVPFGKKLHESVRFATRLWPEQGKNEGFFVAKLVKHG
jgi:NOL1/NOP2/sun family putative RNA methylase